MSEAWCMTEQETALSKSYQRYLMKAVWLRAEWVIIKQRGEKHFDALVGPVTPAYGLSSEQIIKWAKGER